MTNQELFTLIKKNPISVVCGLLSVALAALIYFRHGEIPVAEEALVKKVAEADRHEGNIKNAEKLTEQFEALVLANKEIQSRLVRLNELPTNSQFFFRLESTTGAKLLEHRQTTTVAPAEKPATMPIAFVCRVQGEFSQIIQALYFLESGVHYCRVMSASCTLATPNRGGVLTLSLNLEMLGLP